MLSVFVRSLDDTGICESFLACVPIASAQEQPIKEEIDKILQKYNLTVSLIRLKYNFSVSFDGAANVNGSRAGVIAILRKENLDILYVHCRAHMLQLALVHASSTNPRIKAVLSVVIRLYTNVHDSPKRLRELLVVEQLLD